MGERLISGSTSRRQLRSAGRLEVAVTVHLPDPPSVLERPIVCFAKPGGGYSRVLHR
jgi:hypothetical protein